MSCEFGGQSHLAIIGSLSTCNPTQREQISSQLRAGESYFWFTWGSFSPRLLARQASVAATRSVRMDSNVEALSCPSLASAAFRQARRVLSRVTRDVAHIWGVVRKSLRMPRDIHRQRSRGQRLPLHAPPAQALPNAVPQGLVCWAGVRTGASTQPPLGAVILRPVGPGRAIGARCRRTDRSRPGVGAPALRTSSACCPRSGSAAPRWIDARVARSARGRGRRTSALRLAQRDGAFHA